MGSRTDARFEKIVTDMWQEAYGKGRSFKFRLVSGSMSPLIRAGDVVQVTRCPPSEIRIGDVGAFHVGEKIVVHRVIGRIRHQEHLFFRHRGDAGRSSRLIPANNLIGKVTCIEKEGYHIVLDSPHQTILGRILGWQLGLADTLKRSLPRLPARWFFFIFRPLWIFCRDLPLRNQGK